MKHEMKLQPEYYNFILNGTKESKLDFSMKKDNKLKLEILSIF